MFVTGLIKIKEYWIKTLFKQVFISIVLSFSFFTPANPSSDKNLTDPLWNPPSFPNEMEYVDVESKTTFIKLKNDPIKHPTTNESLWKEAFLHDADSKIPLINTEKPLNSLYNIPTNKIIEIDGLLHMILLHPEGSTLISHSYEHRTQDKIIQPIESMVFSRDRSIFILEFSDGGVVFSRKGIDFQESTKPIHIFEIIDDLVVKELQIKTKGQHPEIIEKIRRGNNVIEYNSRYPLEKEFTLLESQEQFELWDKKLQNTSNNIKKDLRTRSEIEQVKNKTRLSKRIKGLATLLTTELLNRINKWSNKAKKSAPTTKSSELVGRSNGVQSEDLQEINKRNKKLNFSNRQTWKETYIKSKEIKAPTPQKEKSSDAEEKKRNTPSTKLFPESITRVNIVRAYINELKELFPQSKEPLRDTSWPRALGRGVIGFGPQTALFYSAVGASSFLQSLTDQLFIGTKTDPLWLSNFGQEITSLLGLASFGGFVLASGTTDAVISKKMVGGAHIKYEKKLAQLRKEYFLNFDNPKKEFSQLSTDIKELKRQKRRRIKLGNLLRMPAALSAGMLVSTFMHEFATNPNIKKCAEGMKDPSKRTTDFLIACDQAYYDWALHRKFINWLPDIGAVVSAAYISHKIVHFIAKKLPAGLKFQGPTGFVVGSFLNILAFFETHKWITGPFFQKIREVSLSKIQLNNSKLELKNYITELHNRNIITNYPTESCVISKDPEDMTKKEINQWLSSRTLSIADRASLSAVFSFDLDIIYSFGNKCTNRDLLMKFNNQFHLSSNLQQLSFMKFHMAHSNWFNLVNKAANSFSNVESSLEQIAKSNTPLLLKNESFPLQGIQLKRNSADTTDPCLTQQKGDPFRLDAYQQQYYERQGYAGFFKTANDTQEIQNTIDQAVLCLSDLLNNKDIKENKIEDLVSKESGHFLIPKSSNKRLNQILADIRTLLECEQCDLNDPNHQKNIAAGVELLNTAIEVRGEGLPVGSTLKEIKNEQKKKLLLVKNILGPLSQPFANGADFYNKIIEYQLKQEHEHSHSDIPQFFDSYSDNPARETIWNMACGKDIRNFNKTTLNIEDDEEVEDLVQKLPSLTQFTFSKGSFYLFNIPKITNNDLSLCEKYPSYKDLSSNQALSEIITHIKSNMMNQTQLEELNQKIEDQFLIFLDVLEQNYNKIINHHYTPSIRKILSNYKKEVQSLSEIMTLIHEDTLEENTSTNPESKTQACLDIGIPEDEMTKENIIAVSTEKIKEHIQIVGIEKEKSLEDSLICLQSLIGHPSNETYQIEKNKVISEGADDGIADWWIDNLKKENKASCLNRLDDGICNFTKFNLRDQASIAVYRRLRSIVNDVSNLKTQKLLISNIKNQLQSSDEDVMNAMLEKYSQDSSMLSLIGDSLDEALTKANDEKQTIKLFLKNEISKEEAIQHILEYLSIEEKNHILQLIGNETSLEDAIHQYLSEYLNLVTILSYSNLQNFPMLSLIGDSLDETLAKANDEKQTIKLFLKNEISREEAIQHILEYLSIEEKNHILQLLEGEISLEEAIHQYLSEYSNLALSAYSNLE